MSKATNVEAVLVVNGNKMDQIKAAPGAFFYYTSEGFGEGSGIVHSCPCGCGKVGSINFDPSRRPCWTNNGNKEKPTLKPSVGIRPWDGDTDVEADGFHWHGYLKNGVWESC